MTKPRPSVFAPLFAAALLASPALAVARPPGEPVACHSVDGLESLLRPGTILLRSATRTAWLGGPTRSKP